MKKFILLGLCLSATNLYAATTEQTTTTTTTTTTEPSVSDSIRSGWNNFLDMLGARPASPGTTTTVESHGTTTSSTTSVTVEEKRTPKKTVIKRTEVYQEPPQRSVYDGIKEGWNNFIDFLRGNR